MLRSWTYLRTDLMTYDILCIQVEARASKMKVHPVMLLKTHSNFGQNVIHPTIL